MNSHKDPLALPVIKQEFDDDLISSVEGWSPLTGNIVTNSSRTLSTTTTQFVENLFFPTATTTPLPNLINTYPSIASVDKRPKIVHQGQVKILERSNNRPFPANHNNFSLNNSIVQNSNTDLLLNLELQLKQTQKQLKELTVESRNANEIHEKKYADLKLDYFEFKTNTNMKLDTLQVENEKLHDELNQLKNHHQTHIEQSNAQSSINTPNPSQNYQLNSIDQQNVDETSSMDNFIICNKVMIPENEFTVCNLDQDLDNDDDDDAEMFYTANDNSVVESTGRSNAQKQTNRIKTKTPTCSNTQNLPKRKHSQLNRTVKRSKKTIENDDDNQVNGKDGEVNQIEDKIKVLHFDCTEQNCKVKLKTLKHLQDHLSKSHKLLPLRCFAENCNLRFKIQQQIQPHIQIDHSKPIKFLCPVCRKEFASQSITYVHWYTNHLRGQFQCNLPECNLVYDTRAKLYSHQEYNHCPQSKLFVCQHDGCSAAFSKKVNFDQHQLVHLNSKQFHCKWPQCRHRTNRRADLVIHIRVRHFGLPRTVKEQKEKNISEERDPNDFVRVVDDELAE